MRASGACAPLLNQLFEIAQVEPGASAPRRGRCLQRTRPARLRPEPPVSGSGLLAVPQDSITAATTSTVVRAVASDEHFGPFSATAL